MPDSIVAIRLVRNLRYKLTYIKIFETYMTPDPSRETMELLRTLIEAQQRAIGPLSSYLRRLDVNLQDIELDEKLLSHASSRDHSRSRLRFIYEGLGRATSWYKMQLVDKQMTQDPELKQLLFELGEIDAAMLWRTEATMAMLGIATNAKEKDYRDQRRLQPDQFEGWRPRLVEDFTSQSWESSGSPRWAEPGGHRRKDR